MRVTTIKSQSKIHLVDWSGLKEYRDLLYFLALRDIQLRYKQTALGIVWVILQPLVPAIVFAVLFGNFAKLPSNGQPYIILVLCGMLPWNVFNNTLSRTGSSVVANSNLLSKVYFPRIIVPLASLGSVIIDSLVSVVVLAVLLPVCHIPLTANIAAAPVFLLIALISGFGLSLIIASLNVYYRDFNYVVPFVLQILNYVTPVVYSSELIPQKWRLLYSLNPAVGFVEGFRWSVMGSSSFSLAMLLITTISSLLLLVLGMIVFRRMERGFADVI